MQTVKKAFQSRKLGRNRQASRLVKADTQIRRAQKAGRLAGESRQAVMQCRAGRQAV
jgi:hypothetical protein